MEEMLFWELELAFTVELEALPLSKAEATELNRRFLDRHMDDPTDLIARYEKAREALILEAESLKDSPKVGRLCLEPGPYEGEIIPANPAAVRRLYEIESVADGDVQPVMRAIVQNLVDELR